MEHPDRTEPTQFRDLTLQGFVERLASDEPVPGGGSAAAVAGSLGAGLLSMVGALSQGREKYAAFAATHARARVRGAELGDLFLRIADDDAVAYAGFAAAMKLPRTTDEEKAARTQSIRAAAVHAAGVPMICLEHCVELAEELKALAGRCNLNVSSDITVATLLAEAAAAGAGANVEVNLTSIGDPERAQALAARTHELVGRVRRLAEAAREIVARGELRDPEPA